MAALGGSVVFTATDPAGGTEIWASDGTAAGTVRLRDIRAGTASSNPSQLKTAGSTIYFRADDGTAGAELWKTDGTPGGTTLVKDINLGPAASNPAGLFATAGGSRVLFAANDGVKGVELWASDGTTAVHCTREGHRDKWDASNASRLVAVGSKVFFDANNNLWVTDGTDAGTVRLSTTQMDDFSSVPGTIAAALNGRLIFRGSDGELWVSDGTPDGTKSREGHQPQWVILAELVHSHRRHRLLPGQRPDARQGALAHRRHDAGHATRAGPEPRVGRDRLQRRTGRPKRRPLFRVWGSPVQERWDIRRHVRGNGQALERVLQPDRRERTARLRRQHRPE